MPTIFQSSGLSPRSGEALSCPGTLSQPVKSEEPAGLPHWLTAGLASAGLSTAQFYSAFFLGSCRLACPQALETVK